MSHPRRWHSSLRRKLSVCVVPLGGRHVNHFWRLLERLEIPYVTLLDLDSGRFQGGWAVPVPRLRAPLVTVLEAKRGDIELGLGQCVAQMLGARLFNERAGAATGILYGAVTTGEAWQFLKLADSVVTLHSSRMFIDGLGMILAAFRAMLVESIAKHT